MRRTNLLFLLLLPIIGNAANLFYYSPIDGKGGLRLASETSIGQWDEIGDKFNFVSSDFGSWGSGKKMFNPYLIQSEKEWKLIFSVNKEGTVYGITTSPDLIHWKPQEYVTKDNLPAAEINNLSLNLSTITINNDQIQGRFIDVSEKEIYKLKEYVAKKKELGNLYKERTDSDSYRFKNLKNLSGELKISSESKEISPILMGIFFEDINYSADGGLYGELIQNRDFEYKTGEGKDKNWGPLYAWELQGKDLHMELTREKPLSENNPHYVKLSMHAPLKDNDKVSGLYNKGYDGISLKKGEKYKLKFKARSETTMPLILSLVSEGMDPIAVLELNVKPGTEWNEYEGILESDDNYKEAKLRLVPKNEGEIDLDMISLFPEKTFKDRENGLRTDLAQALADLKPRFIRFPGGCVAHGNGIDNIYDWKGSIGPLEDRKPLSNLWGYHQTRGLGYFEYFQFCEDIGAEPLPVLSAGVPCQNSSWDSKYTKDDLTKYGQQQGIPMDSMSSYIQDILDLIEYANGPVTSKWGKKRAESGHPEPFNLKYIGIGNEDMITEVFKPRFTMVKDAIKETYPEITVIGTTGPFYEGPDYEEGWKFAREEKVDMVDEHYYVDPGWLIYNQDFYDNYDREGPKVYLGEWAAHLPDRSSTIETALAEAIYITALERNGDIVSMSSYAPLLAKKNHTQWRPDLIYFDNDSVYPTTDYHIMRLSGENSGDRYIKNRLFVNTDNEKAKARIAASVVRDEKTGETIIKMVNMLPVETQMKIDLSEIIPEKEEGINYNITEFYGSPTDEIPQIKVRKNKYNEGNLEIPLKKYSFTIIRI